MLWVEYMCLDPACSKCNGTERNEQDEFVGVPTWMVPMTPPDPPKPQPRTFGYVAVGREPRRSH